MQTHPQQSSCRRLEDTKVLNHSQHKFIKNKSCQTSRIAFFEQDTKPRGCRELVDVVSLDFSKIKAFDMVLHYLLMVLNFHVPFHCGFSWCLHIMFCFLPVGISTSGPGS